MLPPFGRIALRRSRLASSRLGAEQRGKSDPLEAPSSFLGGMVFRARSRAQGREGARLEPPLSCEASEILSRAQERAKNPLKIGKRSRST
ncbi:MAG: hypothetical protein AUK47_17520 [Deltaproteobacteria bacterium CG2_30_63_29]|nr:MAG: hypothetical protein AUK47_17520 [Deltaproteobacteria bacterium CG2_30_63_29]PJB36989.1 MAG: hypothetical protein CO108_22135 [Deltaproteobacteria bacterium CG_4_9_14_3_um_filter_63_12]